MLSVTPTSIFNLFIFKFWHSLLHLMKYFMPKTIPYESLFDTTKYRLMRAELPWVLHPVFFACLGPGGSTTHVFLKFLLVFWLHHSECFSSGWWLNSTFNTPKSPNCKLIVTFSVWEYYVNNIFDKIQKHARKGHTRYGSSFSHLELGQKSKNPFTDVIFRFQPPCH